MLRNNFRENPRGEIWKDLISKDDSIMDALGIVGSMSLMNIAMEDKGDSLMSKSIIVRGLIEQFHADGILTKQETKELIK